MNDSISPEQEFALRKVEEMFLENIETVFQTGINPETTLQFGSISPYAPNLAGEVFEEGMVAVKISHKNPDSGDEYLLFSTKTAAKISDLMVMGDGTAEFNPDEHLDALQEIVDQIYGAFATSHGESLEIDLEYALASASLGDDELNSMANDSWVAVGFNMELNGEHQIFHILSPEALANFLKEGSKANGVEDELTIDSMGAPLSAGQDAGQPKTAQFQSFPEGPAVSQMPSEIEMLMDLKLPIIIELGRTFMFIKDILKLTPGSIVELEKLSGDPVDIYVNEKKFAEGEVVVIDENFGVRITELIKPEDRLRKLS